MTQHYGVQQIHESTSSAVQRDRTKYAADLVTQWHSPDMVALTIVARRLRLKMESEEDVDIENLIEKTPDGERAILAVCNYFEKLALCIKHEVADESYLKHFFSELLRKYYSGFTRYINKRREKLPTSYYYFEELHKSWHGIAAN